MMDQRAIAWTLLLCVGLTFWFYLNTEMKIDYEKYPQLIDPITRVKRKPSELVDLLKVINITQEYIDSTDYQTRFYDLAYNSNFKKLYATEQSYSNKHDLLISGWPVANQTSCGHQLDWILQQLNSHRNYTLLRGQLGFELSNLMNSFGRPESYVTGWMGSYKRCLGTSLKNGDIKTRYCIGRMRARWWPKNDSIYPATSISIGMCLPETCDTVSFSQHKQPIETLVKFELPDLYKNGLDFESMFCLPDERSPIRKLPASGWIYLAVVGSWIGLVVVASIVYETRRRKRMICIEFSEKPPKSSICEEEEEQPGLLDELLTALSIRCSVKSFKSSRFQRKYNQKDKVRVDLGCLDFFKVMMSWTVVMAHSAMIVATNFRSNVDGIHLSTSLTADLAIVATRSVDTFFLIFGLLTTYTLMRKYSIRQLSNPILWLMGNFLVLLRITPVFMLIYWYSRSVSPYTGSGPWWDYGLNQYTLKGECIREDWWRSIPYFSNIGTHTVPACNIPSWFIISYVQIALLLPLITYIICKLPNYFLRYCLVGFMLLLSSLNNAVRLQNQTSTSYEGLGTYVWLIFEIIDKFEGTGYATSFVRVGCVSLGCLVGYLLKKYEEGEIKQWPRWLTNSFVFFFDMIILMGIAIFQFISRLTGVVPKAYLVPGLGGMILLSYPITNSILLINLVTTRNHQVVVRFMSHPFWHVFNKLGFMIFLVHYEIMYVTVTSLNRGVYYGFSDEAVVLGLYGFITSIFVAFLLYIIVQNPLAGLVNVMNGRLFKSKQKIKIGQRNKEQNV